MADTWDRDCWYCFESVYCNCTECGRPLCRECVKTNDGLCSFCEGERLTEIYKNEKETNV